MTERERADLLFGSSRPRNHQSATQITIGAPHRNTMKVSTLQYCRVLMLVKMEMRKHMDTSQKPLTRSVVSGSH